MTRIPKVLIAMVAAVSVLTLFVINESAAQTSVERTVTIGVIAPVDGGLTSFGRGIRDSVELAVRQANAKRVIPGWNVEVRTLDDSSDPTKGAQAATTLAADESVVAVVGPYNSGVAVAALPVLAEKDLALVSPSNTLTSLTLGDDAANPERPFDNYFRLVGADSGQAAFLAGQARRLDYASAAVVSETKAVSKGLADAFADAFTKAGGSVTVHQAVPDGATNFTDFLNAAKPTSPALLFFGGEYNVAADLRSAATAAGITVPLMGGDGMNDAAYIARAGTASTGSFASGVGVPLARNPGAKRFVAAYRKAGFTTQPSDYGPYAYDAANAIIAKLRQSLDGKRSMPVNIRKQVVSGLQKTNADGVTGRIWFDAYGDTRAVRFTLYRVEGSPPAWTPVATSRATTTK